MDFSLADVARISGAKPRSIQLWADRGVIDADPSTEARGSGKHRRFSRDRVIVACIVAQFAKQGVSIGNLLNIATGVYGFLIRWGKKRHNFFERAAAGTGWAYLVVHLSGEQVVAFTVVDDENPKMTFIEAIARGVKDGADVHAVISLNAALARLPPP